MKHALLALGGNLGDVVASMDRALEALQEHSAIHVRSVSRVYESAPMGSQAGGAYLNAAAGLETSLDPEPLLDQLQHIEQRLGRRAGQRWGARPMDLDLLLVDELVIDSPRLTLPHPQLWYRRFVLDPLVEIAESVIHPLLGSSIAKLREDLMLRPLKVSVMGGCAEDRLAVGTLLQQAGIQLIPPQAVSEAPLQIEFLDGADCRFAAPRIVALSDLPGSLLEATTSVITAAMDEPQVHSRPLRRMP